MNRNKTTFLKFLITFNSLSLYLFFSTRHHHSHVDKRFVTPTYLPETYRVSKPWSILPSYLPWTSSPSTASVRVNTCEAYFGNGFTRRIDLLSTSSDRLTRGGGWFRCFYSETLRSSICEEGRIRMNVDKVKMSKGGDRLEDVIGRREKKEFPAFEDGAFEIHGIRISIGNEEEEESFKLVSREFC